MKTNFAQQPDKPDASKRLNDYSIESCWQWYINRRLGLDGALSPDEFQVLRHIFYVGFGECLDMLRRLGDGQASDDEAGEFFLKLMQEAQDFQLSQANPVGGRQ